MKARFSGMVALKILNCYEIERAFGSDVLVLMRGISESVVKALVGLAIEVRYNSDAVMALICGASKPAMINDILSRAVRILCDLQESPLVVGANTYVISSKVYCFHSDAISVFGGDPSADHLFSATQTLLVEESTARRDMSLANVAFESLSNGRFEFAFQPIVFIGDQAGRKEPILYFESLGRLSAEPNTKIPLSIKPYVIAMERLGVVAPFDRSVLKKVTKTLGHCANGIRLGCNICAQSNNDVHFWQHVVGQLRKKPELAKRLVIEITESSVAIDEKSLLVTIKEFKNVGCSIALDDFFTFNGHSASFAEACRPDLIKIDGAFFAKSRNPGSLKLLEKAVALANELTDTVVIEGIESAKDLQQAADLKVSWGQGFYIGRPTEKLPTYAN